MGEQGKRMLIRQCLDTLWLDMRAEQSPDIEINQVGPFLAG